MTNAVPSAACLADDLYRAPTVAELLVRSLVIGGDKVAVIDDIDSLTYHELGRRIAALSSGLRSLGLRRGMGLGQLSLNRIDALVVLTTAIVMGLRYTPLHPLGSVEDHLFVLRDADVRCVVIDEVHFPDPDLVSGLSSKVIILSHGPSAFASNVKDLTSAQDDAVLVAEADPADPVFLAYTGGTTGISKGVILSNRSILANIQIERADRGWPASPVFLAVTPITHSAMLFVLPVFLGRGTFVLTSAYSPRRFVELVARHRVSVTFLVPTMLYALLDEQGCERSRTESLRLIIYGAAPMARTRMDEAIARFGAIFSQLYGQTEAPNVISMLSPADHLRPEAVGSAGLPTTGVEVRIVDPEDHDVEDGMEGEVCVRGPLVMDGYWKRPTETEAALSGAWLRTGDIGRRGPGGFLFLVDRKKDMLITGGFNVYPAEVEAVLAAHPAIAQSCVIGAPDPKWGERVVAIIHCRPGMEIDASEVIDFVKARKGSVMAPKTVICTDRLPVTALGKLDRKEARRLWGRSPS